MVRSPKLCQERDRFLDKTDSRGLWRVPDEAREGLQLPETDFFRVMDSLPPPNGHGANWRAIGSGLWSVKLA